MKKIKNIDIIIPLCILCFMLISIISIKSASILVDSSFSMLYVKQLSWYFIGFIILVMLLIIKNEKIYYFSGYLYYISLFLLLLVLFVGDDVNGSKAWIFLGPLSFQPSELMKFSLIIYISKVLENYHFKKRIKNTKTEFKLICKTFVITILPSILVFLEPDTGAVISYFLIAIVMLFVSGIKYRWYAILISLASLFFFIISYLYINNQSLIMNSISENIFYRVERIINWKNSSGMQLENSLISIGSSGLFGYGLLNTPLYFPEPFTDFIFAVYASNYGLFGCLLLITLIVIFDLKIISIGINAKSTIEKYTVAGVIASFIFYQIQNISMTIGLLPITGIVLPFISYGGSSLIIYMILTAIVLNIEYKKFNVIKN